MSEFYNQGAVPLSSAAYVSRSFEESVYQEIISNRWVLLLGPRQHGKSTGLVRLRKRFQDAHLIVCSVDLQRLPPYERYAQLLAFIADQLGQSIGMDPIPRPSDEAQSDFLSWLQVIFPPSNTPIIIMIDECATIENATFRNSFYGQIRQINSQRAGAEPSDIAARVRFIFSGTFRPETLVSQQNSPFNVCQPIHTDDLTIDQGRELANNVHGEIAPLVDEAFARVGGQPFLLQTVFLEATKNTEAEIQALFRYALANLGTLAQAHLEGIFSKVIASPSLVEKVSTMVRDGSTRLIPADSDCSFLQVIGLAKRDGTNLVFRNAFYAEVAAESPQLRGTTDAASSSAPVFGLERDSLEFMKSAELRQIACSSFDGGANSHQSGNFRLALVGFGAAMEAVLMDFLVGLQPADLASAVSAAHPNFNQFESATDPKTWRLVNLIKVAKNVNVGTKAPQPSDALREWRNLVHPAEAIKFYPDESKLKFESVAVAALFMIFARDISEIP
jgi:hypothetical protein